MILGRSLGRLIGNVSCPTLFIHGEADTLVPPEHSLRLFERCRARKLLVMPPTMEHNSHLFSDKDFLAIPAIHFFGFPGYHTPNPPRLPPLLFENAGRCAPRGQPAGPRGGHPGGTAPWLCDCVPRGDPHHA